MSPPPTFGNFLRAFRQHWFAAMSGGFSVPFAALAALLDNWPARIGFAALAVASALFAAFRVWHADRTALNKAEAELDRRAAARRLLGEIGTLRTQISALRIEMQQPQALQHPLKYWTDRHLAIDVEIGRRIEELAGPGEAQLYSNRGNIQRRVGQGLPPHQLAIDLCMHDLDALRDFIRDYSMKFA